MGSRARDSSEAFQGAAGQAARGKYVLRLYVTGRSRCSQLAIANVKRACEQHLAGRYDLQVIDIREHPGLAQGEQILAVPTLIKKLPQPLRRIIGDMTDEQNLLLGLDLKPRKPASR